MGVAPVQAQKRDGRLVETGVFGGCNARAHARGGGISLMRTAPKDRAHRCAHSPTGSRFREIAAALTPPYRTPRVTTPALPTADAGPDAQNQGSTELRLYGVLRRLMCNSGQRRRSPDRMLHQTLSKGWCGHGSGLLLGLIVRARGGLVEARSRFAATENRSSCPAQRSGGHHPGHSCPVASVSQREGLLALRLGASAPLLPEPLFAEPAQSAHPSPGARAARSAACLRPRTRLSFGRLSRDGHDPRSGHREGEGFSQGALLWAGFLREERLQDRVGLRLQGC